MTLCSGVVQLVRLNKKTASVTDTGFEVIREKRGGERGGGGEREWHQCNMLGAPSA